MFSVKNDIILLLLLLGFAACQQETLVEPTKGGFKVSLVDEQVMVETKATSSLLESPLVENFNLRIVRNGSDQPLYDGKITNDLIPAPVGVYTLIASYGENPVLGLDAPYYEGKSEVTIESNKTTPVEIPCKVANAFTSISFVNNESDFKELFSSYGVEVGVGNSFVLLDNPLKKAYYKEGSKVKFTFKGILKGNGEEVSQVLTHEKFNKPETFVAGSHCIIKLSLEKTTSGVILNVTSAEVSKVSIEETIPVTWLPKPKIIADGFVGNVLDIYETVNPEKVAINFDLSSALQELKFSMDFEDEGYQNLTGEYVLSEMNSFDRAKFQEVGIILPKIGQQSTSLDLTGLTAKLKAVNEGVVTNKIIVTEVMANDRIASGEYTILTHKPEFSIQVLPGKVWTKEFTAESCTVSDGKGDPVAINSNLTYQYSSDNGGTWTSFNDNMRQIFSTWPENKNYKVRALYRGRLASSSVDVQLETPTQLPNSNMDEWRVDNYQGSRYSYDPWAKKTVGGFWDTNNRFTTRHRTNTTSVTMANYNGMPAVSFVPGRTGWAAELRSTANGKGNTRSLFGHKEHDYNKVAGELYTGTAKVTTGKNDIDAGSDTHQRIKDSEHASRPTGLKFWYKFKPLNRDQFKVSIELLDKDRNIIISNTVSNGDVKNDWTQLVLPLSYKVGIAYEKCKYIHILFSSTITTGKNMQYEEKDYTLYKDEADKSVTYSFFPAYIGSILTIDDIELIYEK